MIIFLVIVWSPIYFFFFFKDAAPPNFSPLPLPAPFPISPQGAAVRGLLRRARAGDAAGDGAPVQIRLVQSRPRGRRGGDDHQRHPAALVHGGDGGVPL